MQVKTWSMEWGGRTLSVEVGKLALLTNGSCVVRYGDTVVLATVVKSKNIRDEIDYFPLTVDFEEKLYAAGKIKGSRFIKREGRPSDDAILAGRLVDRAIRPLFDERIRNDVQVVLTPLAVDGENDASIVSFLAASCAVAISSVPWHGPIAAARIGLKDGKCILNVKMNELADSKLDLVVAGTPDKLIMVEAKAGEVNEEKMLEAMRWGCEQLKPVIDFIEKIQSEIGREKELPPEFADDMRDVKDSVEEQARSQAKQFIIDNARGLIFDGLKKDRTERVAMVEKIEEGLKQFLSEKGFEEDAQSAALKNVKLYVAEEVAKRILDKGQRLDGRKLGEIRPLQIEVDVLPRVHGSALFMRGDTQVLSVVTLGAPGDVQTLDTMEEEGTKRYMHHYNDAPYTYGETGPLRGPGRRAIGHGALAECAVEPVLPNEADFPYAIRVVSEVLGSNGSSSMASVCASSLALMAAGVPIKKPVAGIAIGLASEQSEKDPGEIKCWKVFTDLQDVEDGPGGVDFKIAGTADGITAIQMDTKTFGLAWDIVEETLKQSKDARGKLLKSMGEIISEPRKELSPYAPRIETIHINPDKIRDVIGPGGKIINKIIADTGVKIDIEQDGRVLVTSDNAEMMQKAIQTIKDLTHEVTAGEIYDGTVARLEDFGAFVQILPGQDGLVHVSEIAWERVNKPEDVLNIGDKVKVQVKEIDNLGRINLSMKILKPKPEGYIQPQRGGGFRDKQSFGGGKKKPFGNAQGKKGFF